MATPAQAAAATVGAGSLAAAGAYGITQAVNGSGEEQTTEESTEDSTAPTAVTFKTTELSTYTNKTLSFLKDDHLTKLVKATDDNDKWWDWAFKNRYSNKEGLTLETTFNNLSDSTALKNACNTAYGKDKIYFNTDNFLENIGAFCTSEKLDILEPKATAYQSTDSTTEYPNGLLGVEANKSKLVNTKVGSGSNINNNDLWWEWTFKNVFKKQEGTKSTDFNSVNKAYSASADVNEDKFLNNACDAAYKKAYADLKTTDWQLLKEIKKFCSVDREQAELVLPEPASPTNLPNDTGYSVQHSLVKQNGNPAKLVKPVEQNNQNWWEWSFTVNYPKNATEKSNLPAPFKNVDKAYDSSSTAPSEANPAALNKACEKSYSETKTNLGKKETTGSLINIIKKFCTKNSNQDLTLPTQPA